MPLDFHGAAVGLAGFAWGAQNALIYEQLRDILGAAVHATLPPSSTRTPS
jgi:hypothetical protein